MNTTTTASSSKYATIEYRVADTIASAFRMVSCECRIEDINVIAEICAEAAFEELVSYYEYIVDIADIKTRIKNIIIHVILTCRQGMISDLTYRMSTECCKLCQL